MFTQDLHDLVFRRHEQNGADELLIITGYIGPYPFKELKKLPIKCSVIYGMYGSDSIGEKLHEALNKIQLSSTNTQLHYSKTGIHAKCYLWMKEGEMIDALIGSANFSRNGLETPYREVLVEADPAVFRKLKQYFDHIISNSIPSSSNSVVIKTRPHQVNQKGVPTECKLSFLSKSKEVPKASGLNWGMNSKQVGGNSNTSIGDAEIRITEDTLIDFPSLFPPKLAIPSKKSKKTGALTRQNEEIELIWDDGVIMKGLLEQNQERKKFYRENPEMKGLLYPKAICSSGNKSTLGLYIRNRLGVTDTELITKKHLIDYGRTDVTVSLLAEDVYGMDFSVTKAP